MLSNNLKKYIKSLHQSKYRQKYNKFLAEGTKLVLEILKDPNAKIEMIICTQDWDHNHLNKEDSFTIEIADEKDLRSLSLFKNGGDVICIVEQRDISVFDTLIKNEWAVFLDDVQDPGNVGTILRTCDWFGINTVICSNQTAHPYNPKVVQSSMGAILRLAIHRADFKDFQASIIDMPKYAAVINGNNIFTLEKPKPGLIIIGNESKGIHQYIIDQSSYKVTIPKKGQTESLNAAIAASIIISHFCN